MSSHADTIRRYIDRTSLYSPPDLAATIAALDALVVENQQLRDALASIVSFPISEDLSAGYHFAEVRSIARAALAGTPSEDTEGEAMSKVTTQEAALVRKVLATTGYTAPMHERQEARRIVDKVLPPMHRTAGRPSEDTG